jgi:ornithine cyclodeaminase
VTALPYLDRDTVLGLLPWREAVRGLEAALLAGLDPAGALQRSVHDVRHGQLLLMPAETATAVGVKVTTVAPENPGRGLDRIQALYVLHDPVSLTPVALLDGTALTTLRTPAVSAVAVDHLAPADASRLVVFGSGPQAWGHVEALRSVRPLRTVTVVGRDPSRAETLAGRLCDGGLEATVGDAASVAEADVVACATTARTPLFDPGLLREDACVVAVGSHEPDARELDEQVFARAARVVVECREVALREAGDVVLAVRAGAVEPDDLQPLDRVVRLSPAPGLSVFKSVGMGWEDLVVAEAVHRAWRERSR